MADLFKRHWMVGPGGIKCECCGPPPGRTRKAARRLARTRLKQQLKKELMEVE